MKIFQKKMIKIWVVFLGFFIGFAFFPSLVLAQEAPRITVVFQEKPLFNKTNFVPEDEATRFVRVTNNTGEKKVVIVEAINYSACPLLSFKTCLAKKLHLKITSGSETYFDKSLSEFYGSVISLGDVSSQATKSYDFQIVFEGGSDDNSYKESTTNFDLLVGFSGEEGGGTSSDGSGTTGGSGGGTTGGSGGGSVLPPGLLIQNEATIIEQNGSVAVSWTTNYNSYGHVIWSNQDEIGLLNLSLPNFGYAHSAPSDPHFVGHIDTAQSLNHSLILSSLAPGIYRYRIVSHASPPTVGYERTFVVPGVPEKVALALPSEEELLLNRNQTTGQGSGIVNGADDSIVKDEAKSSLNNINVNGDLEISKNKNINNNSFASSLASAGMAFQKISLPWMLGIAILALILGYFTAKKKKK